MAFLKSTKFLLVSHLCVQFVVDMNLVPYARASEWADSFLKPAARKTFSYIRDTTDFVKHIEDLDSLDFTKEEFYLVTMDVCSLYPNIDHEEGALACKQALDKR